MGGASSRPDFFELPSSRVAVVMIDFQNDFCSPDATKKKPPTNTLNAAAAGRANVFAGAASERGAHVVYTQQVLDFEQLTPRQRRWERPGGLCAAGSWGAELFVEPVPGSTVVVKDRFDCWQSADFVAALEDRNIDGLIICGVELACCVLFAVQGASERGYHYMVPSDLVSGQDTGEATDNAAVRDFLSFNQPEHVIDSGADILDRWPVSTAR